MSEAPSASLPHLRQLRPVAFMVVRLVATITLLLVVYYQMPVHAGSVTSDLPWLLLELCMFVAIVGVQVPLILRARYPFLRAMEAMGLSVCLYVIMFARLYVTLSGADTGAFSEALDHSNALYFTVTVFATVGFGDIVADSNPVKLVVTVQMILNLVVLGVVVRLLLTAGQRGREQRRSQS